MPSTRVMNGYATTITGRELDKNGGGIRVTRQRTRHSGGPAQAIQEVGAGNHHDQRSTPAEKFETGSYIHSGGLHGVGASGGQLPCPITWKSRSNGTGTSGGQRYRAGKPLGPVTKENAARGTGTSVYFRPDPAIFGKQTTFDSTPAAPHPRGQVPTCTRDSRSPSRTALPGARTTSSMNRALKNTSPSS